jgi:hypothetical protein
MAERQAFGPASRLEYAAGILSARLSDLEARIRDRDETAWEPYLATLNTLAAVLPHVTPGARGELLTTAQMAARLGLRPKTLLKHKAAGVVKPALQRGKLIRWKGDEGAR